MLLRHKLKGPTRHDIPIDVTKALDANAFALYTETKSGVTTPIALGWRLLPTVDAGKHVGHEFELRFGPAEIDRAIEALQWAKAKLTTGEVASV